MATPARTIPEKIALLKELLERHRNRHADIEQALELVEDIDTTLYLAEIEARQTRPAPKTRTNPAPFDTINRIREVRDQTGCGLHAAKTAIEACGYDVTRAVEHVRARTAAGGLR